MRSNDPPGSPVSLDAWVKANWPRAVVYARSLLRERSIAEDIVQDCFCSLLRKADTYDLLRDGLRLLLTSIRHACLKKNTRDRPMLSLTSSWEGIDGQPIDPADAAATEPPRIALRAELESAIATALASLSETQRAAVELKAMGHSLSEIAEILEVSPSNAGVLVHRGRHTLAQLLAPFLERNSDERTGA